MLTTAVAVQTLDRISQHHTEQFMHKYYNYITQTRDKQLLSDNMLEMTIVTSELLSDDMLVITTVISG
jgi:hypothetical protein